jgi:hypothetical protein
MATCSTCGLSVDDALRFCSHCGSLSQQSKPFSYGGSVVLGIALLVFAVVCEVVPLAPPRATSTQTVTPEPPDDAAVLLTNCGQPDADKPDSKNGTQSRSLLYQKARVKAVFVRADSSSRWKTQAMLDPKTLKSLTTEKLAKRLPCASGKPSSLGAH